MDQIMIQQRIQYLERIIADKKSALKKAPAGNIRVDVRGDQAYFDYYRPGAFSDKRHLRTSDTRDMQLARRIAQRGYDEKVLKCAAKEFSVLKRLEKIYEGGCVEDVYPALGKARRDLIQPVRETDEQFAARWLAREYPKKIPHPDAVCYRTARGDTVYSKSEVFIADTLDKDNAPYHYEFPVRLIDHKTGRPYTAHPDFMVLNVRKRKEYIWEHFGKMDDPEYTAKSLAKLIDYEKAGFFPGENLIITFETLSDPFTPAKAEFVIRHYLI